MGAEPTPIRQIINANSEMATPTGARVRRARYNGRVADGAKPLCNAAGVMDHFPPAQSLRQEIGPLLEDVFAAIPRRAEEARAAAGDEGDVEGVDLPLLGAFEVRAADGRDAVALGVRVAAEWEVGRAREQATELGAHLALDGAAADGEVAQLGVVRAGVALLDVCEQPSRLVDRAQEALWRRLVRRAQRHERAERRSFRLVELAQVGARNPAADAVRDEVDLAAGVPARRNQKESRRIGKDPEKGIRRFLWPAYGPLCRPASASSSAS